jgi:DNA repair exonuclease SbcCD ATPase subunit
VELISVALNQFKNAKNCLERLKRLIAQGQEGRRPLVEVTEELKGSTAAKEQLEKNLTRLTKLRDGLEASIKVRRLAWTQYRSIYSKRTKMHFSAFLSRRHFVGEITFDHGHDEVPGKMTLSVNPNKADWNKSQQEVQVQSSQPSTGSQAQPGSGKKRRGSTVGADGLASTQALSGGERSFSTVALLLALWEVMEMPFCAMDEFDVFMDQVNRRISVTMLVQACEARSERQYIFISPHTTAHIPKKPHVRIIRMQPPQRGQQQLNFQPQENS